jgi:hypothetical protein
MNDPLGKKPRPPRRERVHDPPESLESLLASGGVIRYLEARVHGALTPWLGSLSREEIAWVRARLFVELTMDPVLRGLVAQLARAFEKRKTPADDPSRVPGDGSRLF